MVRCGSLGKISSGFKGRFNLCPFGFSAEEEAVLESILRDRSHIEETLRLAADEKAGDFAGEDMKPVSLTDTHRNTSFHLSLQASHTMLAGKCCL